MPAGKSAVPITAIFRVSETQTRSMTLAVKSEWTVADTIELARRNARGEEMLTGLMIRLPAAKQ